MNESHKKKGKNCMYEPSHEKRWFSERQNELLILLLLINFRVGDSRLQLTKFILMLN